MRDLSRRGFLRAGTGAALVTGGAALAPIAAAAPLAPLPELLSRYAVWLHMERRLVSMEMWPELGPKAEDFVPADRHATRFHFPWDGRSWRDVPPPSTRAALVLITVGVFTGPDPEALSKPGPGPCGWGR